MDFMKVFDQTVREIKREVNLKVLKVPEIEQKVLDATDDEPWGPHGSALAEIAQATRKFTECQMIMNVLWTRLSETGKNWRVVYKALAVLEYLVGHGSERAVDEIIEHTFQISSLTSFEYVEPSGKDVGLNVRKKAENIVALLKDRDKIQETRNKASANREKYIGLSSTGATYKSSSASSGTSSIHSSGRYGGTSNTRDSRSFRDAYKDRDPYGEKDAYPKSSRSGSYDDQEKKSSIRVGSKKQGDAKLPSNSGTSLRVSAPSNSDDEFDDFDPRGTSTKSATGTSNQVDLFGQSLIGDLLDVVEPVTFEMESTNGSSSEVDLFADAAFVSAPSQVETSADSHSQVDLFASRPAIPSVAPATIDFFSAADIALQPETTAPKPEPSYATVADPFAAVSMNSFEGSDLFGAFNSGSNSASTEAAQISVNDISIDNVGVKSSVDSNPQSKQGVFQVKSGIWADSLARGLIDLNISAPKKVSLVDVGVIGDLSDGQTEMVKGPPVAFYMGRAMGTGSGLGKTGFQPSQESQSQAADVGDFFSSLGNQHYHFGNSNKEIVSFK